MASPFRSDAAMPDLTSAEALRTLLLSAEKIAYIDPNGGGTSGPFFEKMFASLGIADAVHAKAVLCRTGADIDGAVASGRATIGMTQASEIVAQVALPSPVICPMRKTLSRFTRPRSQRGRAMQKAPRSFSPLSQDNRSDYFRRAGWDIDR